MPSNTVTARVRIKEGHISLLQLTVNGEPELPHFSDFHCIKCQESYCLEIVPDDDQIETPTAAAEQTDNEPSLEVVIKEEPPSELEPAVVKETTPIEDPKLKMRPVVRLERLRIGIAMLLPKIVQVPEKQAEKPSNLIKVRVTPKGKIEKIRTCARQIYGKSSGSLSSSSSSRPPSKTPSTETKESGEAALKTETEEPPPPEAAPSFTCVDCKSIYDNFYELRSHLETIHCKPYVCNVCLKAFRGNDALEYHIRLLHSNWNPIQLEKGQVLESRPPKKVAAAPPSQQQPIISQTSFTMSLAENLAVLISIPERNEDIPTPPSQVETSPQMPQFKAIDARELRNNISCCLCDRHFPTFGEYREHMRRQHPKEWRNSKVCPNCRRVFCSFIVRKLHIMRRTCLKDDQTFGVDLASQIFQLLPEYPEDHLNKIKEHNCPLCYYTFSNDKDILTHLKSIHKVQHNDSLITPQDYEAPPLEPLVIPETIEENCSECRASFKSKDALHEHLKYIHNLRHSCNFCNRGFETYYGLENHIRQRHHREWSSDKTCPHCSRVFCSDIVRTAHLEQKTCIKNSATSGEETTSGLDRVTEHNCFLCNYTFGSLAGLQKHMRRLHKVEDFCYACKLTFNEKTHLQAHEIEKHFQDWIKRKEAKDARDEARKAKKTVQCDICKVYLVDPANLKVHMEWHAKKGESIPEIVQNVPRKSPSLLEEYLTMPNLDLTSFSFDRGGIDDLIEIENYVVPKQENLNESSVQDQSQEQPPAEPEAMLEISNDALQIVDVRTLPTKKPTNSQRAHAGQLKCIYCKPIQSFSSKSIYHAHLDEVHERFYRCRQCIKAFKSKDGLRDHGHIHTGRFQFRCSNCSRGFARKQALTRHKMNSLCLITKPISKCDQIKFINMKTFAPKVKVKRLTQSEIESIKLSIRGPRRNFATKSTSSKRSREDDIDIEVVEKVIKVEVEDEPQEEISIAPSVVPISEEQVNPVEQIKIENSSSDSPPPLTLIGYPANILHSKL